MPWEGVFQSSLNLHEDILDNLSGVSKKPEMRPTCLWVMTKVCQIRAAFPLVINTPKLVSAKNQVFKHWQKVTRDIHFYFLTQTFNTTEPPFDILQTKTVWQFQKLEHLSIHHLGRWHIWVGSSHFHHLMIIRYHHHTYSIIIIASIKASLSYWLQGLSSVDCMSLSTRTAPRLRRLRS